MTSLGLGPPAGAETADALSGEESERLREYFYQRTGIYFGANKRYFVDKRVRTCMAEYGTDSFATYLSALRLGLDNGLFQRLVNALTVNETYFLREDYQLEILVLDLLPALVACLPSRPLRILSLPCSTGDEAYSIAITLLEKWKGIDEYDVEIVGADIDSDALEQASRGVYGPRAIQRISRSVLDRYFSPVGDGRYRISAELTSAVRFIQANVADVGSMRQLRCFDIVFCRNLLIYFDELSSRIAAQNLFDVMRPGAFLLLGHAESMSRISDMFVPRRLGAGIVYQRPL